MLQSLSGQIIDGYKVGDKLGDGAMGEVYKAHDSSRNVDVAMKVLRGRFVQDEAFHQRFEREVKLMESLKHENIMPIMGYGNFGEGLYFTMKLVEGASLIELMEQQRLTPLDVWVILEQLANGLSYGHNQGVIHRDIKPENIFYEKRGDKLKILLGDFGLGKKPGHDNTLTADGSSIGTPEYMAPEAALGKKLDHRADTYSLAILVYEMLIGVVPFDTGHEHLTALAQINQAPPLPTAQNPIFPNVLEPVVMKGLAKDREDRYQSATELATDYKEALDKLSDSEKRTIYWII